MTMSNARNAIGTRLMTAALLLAVMFTSFIAAPIAEASSVSGSAGATTGATGAGTTGVAGAAGTNPQPKVEFVCQLGGVIKSTDLSGCLPLFASWLGSWFLTIGGAFLRITGYFFDALTYHIIIAFASTLDYLKITDAINTGWTVFRDLSNMLIIGMFVFIAISIILGLKEYGQKRLIANVLIVAVLINFSLLFTKLIIDFSNFTSYQVYTKMTTNPGGGQSSFDIAGSFLAPMGITSIWDSSGLVTDQVLQSTQSGLQAFAFGLVGGIMLTMVAAVLAYGCFLIIARGILLIFLMLTGPLAFATYLIPNFAKSEYGWNNWWKTLINSAAFAPLLMIFLAISLAIVNAAGTAAQQQTKISMGAIIANPAQQLTQNSSAWVTIMVYMIGTGLLFVSLRLASKFAGTISGLATPSTLAQGALKVAAFAPIGVGGPLLGTMLQASRGTRALGRLETAKQDLSASRQKMGTMYGDLQATKATHGERSPQYRAALKDYNKQVKATVKLAKKADKAEEVARKDYNVADTAPAKAVAKAVGVPEPFTGQTPKKATGGVLGKVERQAKEAEKITKRLEPTAGDEQAIQEKHRREAERRHEGERTALNEQLRIARATQDGIRKQAATDKARLTQEQEQAKKDRESRAAEVDKIVKGIQPRHEAAVKEKETITKEVQTNTKEINERANNQQVELDRKIAIETNPAEITKLKAEKETVEVKRGAELRTEQAKIQRVTAQVEQIESEIKQARQPITDLDAKIAQANTQIENLDTQVANADRDVRQKENALKQLDQQIRTEAKEAGDREINAMHAGLVDAAAEAGRQVAENPADRPFVVDEVRSAFKKRTSAEGRMKRFFQDMNKEIGTGEPPQTPSSPISPTPPPTPPSPPPAH
ncbi:MAG: hypothetical protein JO019_04075 [Candidatus Kaiserbacteria bacterium]|nr:hypothetical protein [Candidatus Kaiserbacteria bacterium]